MTDTPVCFEDGPTAHNKYGVPIYFYKGPCPKCNTPYDVSLSYNPFDTNYYFHCFGCRTWWRWCNISGSMLDLAIVRVARGPGYDENGLDNRMNKWKGTPW